jgi:hypothetical protein
MGNFLLVHRHVHDYTPGPAAAAARREWFHSLGVALVDPGNAVLDDRGSVGDPGTPLLLGGYTIVDAESLEDALRLAHTCPAVHEGGAVEVGRLTPRPGRQHPARVF